MVKLTKIYTRTGDTGQTHLAGGHRIDKHNDRIHAIGDIDELNSWMGAIVVEARGFNQFDAFITLSLAIQQQLFNLGAQLAILPEDVRNNSPCITQQNINALEQDIDNMNAELPALTSFILPGGNELSSRIHIARTVCRRAERLIFKLASTDVIEALLLQYMNRLSDWLFVAARFVCAKCQTPETLWLTS